MKEIRREGSFDARLSPTEPRTREAWASSLIERLEKRNALYILDARNEPLPDFLQERLTKPDIGAFDQYMQTTFGVDWKRYVKGRTFAMAYTKFGHGHKHQAFDTATVLAHMTNSRVIVFDPMDALPDRERDIMLHKKNIHKAMQQRDITFLKELKQAIAKRPDGPAVQSFFDHLFNQFGYNLAEIAVKNLPAQQETGNSAVLENPSVIAKLVNRLITINPKMVVRSFAAAETELTERSVAAATAAIAAQYGADAILTTHANTIRALTPDVLGWVPKHLRKAARHALQTIIIVTPDNGYTKRKPDGSEVYGLSPEERIEDMAIASPHAMIFHNTASWFRRGLHVVPDNLVADRFHAYWGAPRSEYVPLGTVADTISPQEFVDKWSDPERRILIASNGNGSNITDAVRAIREIGNVSPTWLTDHELHLDIFLADLPANLPMIREAAHKAGMQDQIEVIDYTKEFFDKKRPFSYTHDHAKRIHIAYGLGDAAGSDLKQWMQRAAHVELKPPGEQALTGAKVGTLELGTSPGGPNEIYNMAWAVREKLAYPTNWTADINAPKWQTAGLTTEHGLIDDAVSQTFPELIDYLRTNHRMDMLAKEAYRRVNKQTIYGVIGLLTGELFRRDRLPGPDRETLKQSLIAYMKNRDSALNEELSSLDT